MYQGVPPTYVMETELSVAESRRMTRARVAVYMPSSHSSHTPIQELFCVERTAETMTKILYM